MTKIEETRIPAFQRKKKLEAKARKAQAKLSNTPRTPKRQVAKLILDEPPMPKPSGVASLFSKSIEPSDPTTNGGFSEASTCGTCTAYYEKINVAVLELTGTIKVGDQLVFEKEGGLFVQTVESMQIDRQDVQIAYTGDHIGLKTTFPVKKASNLYRVV